MKKIIGVVFIMSMCFLSHSQSVKGVILDKKTNEKICFATVYFDNTFVGTTSNNEGQFSLKLPANSNMPLVVSSIGYYSVGIPKYTRKDPLVIYLSPKDYQIRELNVLGKSLVRKRKKYLRIFKKQFLGNTENGITCVITNEEDISFNYHSCSDTLKCFALKPIEIENKALGYKVQFFLDKFEYHWKTQSLLYLGNTIFKEDFATNGKNKLNYLGERKDTYLGSRMHFFRSLWNNKLTMNGFSVRDEQGTELRYDKFVHHGSLNLISSKEGRKKYVGYLKDLYIYHYSKVSHLKINEYRVYFDKRGYFDIGLFWKGELADKRVGDKLPYEYVLE
ncbi:carboxypeptidase-like regulatory domain-containing protein [Ancylomarina sp. YFZ004]